MGGIKFDFQSGTPYQHQVVVFVCFQLMEYNWMRACFDKVVFFATGTVPGVLGELGKFGTVVVAYLTKEKIQKFWRFDARGDVFGDRFFGKDASLMVDVVEPIELLPLFFVKLGWFDGFNL